MLHLLSSVVIPKLYSHRFFSISASTCIDFRPSGHYSACCVEKGPMQKHRYLLGMHVLSLACITESNYE